MPDSVAPLLDVSQISIRFGGLKAVQEFTLKLPQRSLHGLIGPNGAGKTTVFNLLTGVYRTETGSLKLGGREISRLAPHQIAAAGMTRTFQNIRLLGDLSVLDNVQLACQLRGRLSLPGTLLRTGGAVAQERAIAQRSRELLGLFDLQDRAGEQARNLSYGHQRRLEIIRALATEPRVLLLDEPAAGMNSQEKKELASSLRHILKTFDLSILLIEHDMGLVMDVCEQITVLDHGETIAHGPPDQIQGDPKVIEAYLGAPAAQ
jgi:branched-chain amino acid transport system ATP-binding protein